MFCSLGSIAVEFLGAFFQREFEDTRDEGPAEKRGFDL